MIIFDCFNAFIPSCAIFFEGLFLTGLCRDHIWCDWRNDSKVCGRTGRFTSEKSYYY